MKDDILDSLEDLGYSGPLIESEGLTKAVEEGPKSVEYTKLIEWLSTELKVLCKLDDQVNAITTPDDSSSFVLEVSSFLRELNCPYKQLMEGQPSQRLLSKQSRLSLIDFLCTELQAARMILQNKPDVIKSMQVDVDESPTAADLKTILIALGFPKPPSNITAKQLFGKVETKVKELLSKLPSNTMTKPLFNGVLSDKQWHILDEIQSQLKNEYRLRRDMLVKRLDVTIQSFKWSSRAKSNENDIAEAFQSIRKHLCLDPDINLADVLAARETIVYMEKTSSASVRKNTKSSINKVMIGAVPDRGGRPSEQQAPPPEMPSWQKRSDGQSGGGGRGGGGRGDNRNRVQGGWSGKSQDQNWNQDRRGGNYSSYQDNSGGSSSYTYQDRGYNQGGGYQGGSSNRQDYGGGGYQGSYQDNRGYQGGGSYQGGYQGGGNNQGGYQDSGQRQRGGRRGRGGGGGRGGYRGNNYVDTNAAAYYQNQGPQYYANVDYQYDGSSR